MNVAALPLVTLELKDLLELRDLELICDNSFQYLNTIDK